MLLLIYSEAVDKLNLKEGSLLEYFYRYRQSAQEVISKYHT